jgi:xylulokinase
MDLILGIDVGTTNWKAAVYNKEGDLQALRTTTTKTHHDSAGRAFYDPHEMWQEAAHVVKEVVDTLSPGQHISAVAVASMGESGVPIDEHGEPTYPSIAWFDMCSIPQSAYLEQRVGSERIFRITGLDNNPIFSLSKILWLREHAPDAFQKTVKWLSISDYINYKLAHVYATDYTIASRTLALDLRSKTWSQELLDAVNLAPALFPDIYPSGTVIGAVTRQAALETGLAQGTPVVMGGHDHFCGFLASGCLLGNRILDSSGTVESLVALLAPDATPPEETQGLRIGFFLDPNRYSSIAGVLAAGVSVDWGMQTFASLKGWHTQQNSHAMTLSYHEVFEEVKKTDPGARGIFYVPHLRGAGGPFWDPLSRGTFVGLRATHTQPELIRAMIEGICFEMRMILETMVRVFGHPFEAMHTIGGGTRNIFWQEIKASILGLPIELPDVEEATAKGAALLAGVGTGIYDDLYQASQRVYRVKTRFEPDPELVATYHELFEIYRQIYPALKRINTQIDRKS